MTKPTAADLDWLIETFESNSSFAEAQWCVGDDEHREAAAERERARAIVEGVKAALAEG